MYKYFVPDEPQKDGGTIQIVSDKLPSLTHSKSDIVPLYDEDGRFIATFIFLLF